MLPTLPWILLGTTLFLCGVSNVKARVIGGHGPFNASTKTEIDSLINDHAVALFSKTYCRYSRGLKQILSKYRIRDIVVTELNTRPDGRDILDYLESKSGIHTVPQLFIAGKFIGGHDVSKKLDQRGTLRELLLQANALLIGPSPNSGN